MGRKLRHVHAKKDEYVVVHRGCSGGGGSGGGGSSSGFGCFSVLAIILGIYAVFYILINFWHILLTIGAIALIIYFRKPIWSFLKLIWEFCVKKHQQIKAAQQTAKPQRPVQGSTTGPSSNTTIGNSQYINDHPYGKIVQYKD